MSGTQALGLSLAQVQQAILGNGGKLTPELRQQLLSAPPSEELIDAFQGLVVSHQNAVIESAMSPFGGKEGHDKVLQAVQAAASDTEKAHLEQASKTNIGMYATMLDGLKTKYVKNEGEGTPTPQPQPQGQAQAPTQPNPLLTPLAGGGTGPKGYASRAELNAAMRDDKWRTDPSYQREVREKLQASDRGAWDE